MNKLLKINQSTFHQHGIMNFHNKILRSPQKIYYSTKNSFVTENGGNIKARNFSFSGCGFLIPFHLGIVKSLQEKEYIHPSSKFAGASGGAIVAVSLACNIPVSETLLHCKEIARVCRQKGTAWKLGDILHHFLQDKLPDDVYQHANHRASIATTQLWPKPEIQYHDTFESKADIVDALMASCYLPSYSSPPPILQFRNGAHVDGGLFRLVPDLPNYLKICVFPAHILMKKDYVISPSLMKSTFPYNLFELLAYSLRPPEESVLDDLYLYGQACGHLWINNDMRG